MGKKLVYTPHPTKTHPMENAKRTGVKRTSLGKLKRCPYCHEVSVLQAYDFECVYMPSLDSDPNDYVFSGCDGECPECNRYVQLKQLENVPNMDADK